MAVDFTIRPARPEDDAQLKGFIHGLQVHEHAFEKNRRIDDAVAGDYFAVLMRRVSECDGRILVAEREGVLLGWLASLIEEHAVYVREEERKTGYIAELFVAEEARRQGVANALAAAAEEDLRARGLKTVMIGVLAGNGPAGAAYASWGYSPYAIELRKRL